MIDRDALRTLGWSEELISAAERVMSDMPQALDFFRAPDFGGPHEGSNQVEVPPDSRVASTTLFVR